MTHDPKKRKANKRKHKVDLTEGYSAFDAPMVTQEDTREYDGESEPHLISCRKAEPHEQEAYFREYPQI
jgi:uncharacterized DUF497 family protein